MSNYPSEKPVAALEQIEGHPKGEPVYDAVERGEKTDYDRQGAVDAEKIEHDMTVMQAIKAYPHASFWAFVMSCTIVSS